MNTSNLLIPDRDGKIRAKVNWKSPLAVGLGGAWVFNTDILNDATGFNQNQSITGTITREYTPYGFGCYETSGDKINVGSIPSSNRLSGVGAGAISCYMLLQVANSTDNGNDFARIITKSPDFLGTNGYCIHIRTNLGQIKFSFRQNGNYIGESNNVFTRGEWAGVGLTAEDGDVTRWYKNGIFINALGAVGTFSSATTNLTLLNRPEAASDRGYRKPIVCILLWNKALSPAEHRKIHDEVLYNG